MSIASADGKQHLSEVVFENDLVSGSYPYTQDKLASTNSDSDFMNTITTGDECWVYGYDPETKPFQHSPYNEYPARALNTTSLK